jgi:GTP-binding protein
MSGFVDEAQVHVKAGNGGAGSVSFRREAHVEKGGPDGGDGGDGGEVVLEASHDVVSLLAFKDHPFRRAGDGVHGQGQKKHGKRGADLIVKVPEGTIVRTLEGEILADLEGDGDRLLVAERGVGGHGNARFLSNRLRAPAFAEQGEFGQERWLNLELKLLADVALVGFPNVGKSTLVSRVSAAKPKIADYPFTTLEPHLGVVRVGGEREGTEFTIADIPGLIEGASHGRGLGFDFLRHIERARVLLVLADLSANAERAPDDQVRVLLDELGSYRPELLERPRLVIGSRADMSEEGVFFGDLVISSVTGEGIDRLVNTLAVTVRDARAAIPSRSTGVVIHRPRAEGFGILREGNDLVVTGRDALRAVAVSDLNNADALALVQGRLKRLGVDRELRRAGAREGDTVRIGDLTFEYSADQ